ncbi:hypothetical protein ACOI1C_07475 [Bacillus sp. DJP31]|uniref:hypothetical protein n=1 Tax=Bacillus sp. DJP31 TaxID=3409789 RepID=UPI003BB5E3CD
MSDYQHYLEEKEKINNLLQTGYQIRSVQENLSGAFVQFEKENESGLVIETLHILTAEARKYFSVMMIHQNQG